MCAGFKLEQLAIRRLMRFPAKRTHQSIFGSCRSRLRNEFAIWSTRILLVRVTSLHLTLSRWQCVSLIRESRGSDGVPAVTSRVERRRKIHLCERLFARLQTDLENSHCSFQP